jgi:hypothetical protein
MGYAFGSIGELGEGYGFRKVRHALGVTAFGVNAIVYPPGYQGFNHYHDTQDELYFVHAAPRASKSTARSARSAPGGFCTSNRRRHASCPMRVIPTT